VDPVTCSALSRLRDIQYAKIDLSCNGFACGSAAGGVYRHLHNAPSTGEAIETQGKPQADTVTGLTDYADADGYHRKIQTSEIVRTTQGQTTLNG